MSHRDITAHRYQTLRMEDVFYTVKTDFPQIENQLKDILKAEKNEQNTKEHQALRPVFFFCLRRSTGSTASRCASAAPIRQISTAPPADTGRGACDVLALAMRLRGACDARGN